MTLEAFKTWARAKAHEMGWSLDLLTNERDGIVTSCEAWFDDGTTERNDRGQGYWHNDGDVATW